LQRSALSADASPVESPIAILRGARLTLARAGFPKEVYEEYRLIHQTYRLTGVVDLMLFRAWTLESCGKFHTVMAPRGGMDDHIPGHTGYGSSAVETDIPMNCGSPEKQNSPH
jgi:hypothetical protein